MTGILYDFITASILSIAVTGSVFSIWPAGGLPDWYLLLPLPGTLLSVLFLHSNPRGKIILSGLFFAIAAGTVLSRGEVFLNGLTRTDLSSLWILAGSVLSVLYVRLMKHFPILRVLTFLLFIAFPSLCLLRRQALSKPAVLMILLFLVLSVIEWIQGCWKKEGDTDREKHTLLAMPFLAVLFLSLFLIQAPEKPFDWKIVRDIARDIRSTCERILQMFDHEDEWIEGEGKVGFSEESGFFSSVRSSEYEVFEVKSNTALNSRIYMSGQTFDEFDGRRWRKRDDSEQNYRMYDVLETVASVIRFSDEHMSDYLRSSSLDIEYKGIRTAHVFLPGKSLPVIRNRTAAQRGGDLWFKNKRTRTYSVDFFRMNRSYQGFEEFMNSGFTDDILLEEETMKKVRNSIQHLDLSGYDERGLIDYRNEIREVYGKDPQLSQELNAFLAELLEGAQSDYEKLKRAEAMLGAMEYTNAPGELPEEVTSPAAFADYLIFQSRRGYCTHYATAFVLIARSLGYPARYVQGYCFTTSEDGTTNVLSGTAHAWPEVYFPGKGWISFEPTPGFLILSGWKVKDPVAEQQQEEIRIAVEEEEEEEEEETEAAPTPQPGVTVIETQKKSSAFLPILSVIAFLIVFLIADLTLRRLRYGRKNDREKITYLFSRCMRILGLFGLSLRQGETLAKFACRASLKLPEERLKFIPVYEEIIYGEREITPADIERMEHDTRELFRFWLNTLRRKKEDDL